MHRVGDLRFNLPQLVDPYTGTHTAVAFGYECPQQSGDSPPITGIPLETLQLVANLTAGATVSESEDCEQTI